MQITQILLYIGVYLILPLFLFYNLWRSGKGSQFAWIVRAVLTGTFLLFILLVGRWDWFSIYLRYIYITLYAITVCSSYWQMRHQPFTNNDGRGPWRRNLWPLLELGLMIAILAYIATGFSYGPQAVRLDFPLQDGQYYIAHGGDNPLINAHNPVTPQQFALDVTELNAAGVRTEGIYPAQLAKYAIYEEVIHSPCEGTVVAATDGRPDNIPPATDSEHPAGNHVVIACHDVLVLLAHMENGSVMVEENAPVQDGQPLGLVGNSGNSSEPHLHIHAVRQGSGGVMEGAAVPLQFADTVPVRNTIITN